MYEKIVTTNEAGQRLDKFLHKYLPEAGNGFLYKMLRKKNITLNGKKAEGKEMLATGDLVRFFLSEETIAGFQNNMKRVHNYSEAFRRLEGIQVIYENEHILIADKPTGVLSQKADSTDDSLNEWLVGYLLEQGKITKEELQTFKPSICNRLDRNTSGMVICAKTLAGSQEMSRLLKKREIHKFYHLYVKGKIEKPGEITDFLIKDEQINKVQVISLDRSDNRQVKIKDTSTVDDAVYGVADDAVDGVADDAVDFVKDFVAKKGQLIITRYKPLQVWSDRTLLEVELITGKTHQIRAHLADIGHPLIGDYKYGDKKLNDSYKKHCQVESQLLHACRLEFPAMSDQFADLSGLTVVSKPPEVFRKMKEYP